jgi:hypothetical protein
MVPTNLRRDRSSHGAKRAAHLQVAGEYTYLCIPHAVDGMVGTINVDLLSSPLNVSKPSPGSFLSVIHQG